MLSLERASPRINTVAENSEGVGASSPMVGHCVMYSNIVSGLVFCLDHRIVILEFKIPNK